MGKLLQEAELDDRFNVQMKKVQDAIGKLDDILDAMLKGGSMTKVVKSQQNQLQYAADDFERLFNKSMGR